MEKSDIEAVFNRLIYIPFLNKPFSEGNDNKHFSANVCDAEKDAIFTWAMQGLQKYIDSNECFPHSKQSLEFKEINMARYCSEKSFYEKCIEEDESCEESIIVVRSAYAKYCEEHKVTTTGNISNFITVHKKIGKNKCYELLGNSEIKSKRIGKVYKVPKPFLIEFIMNSSNSNETKNPLEKGLEANE